MWRSVFSHCLKKICSNNNTTYTYFIIHIDGLFLLSLEILNNNWSTTFNNLLCSLKSNDTSRCLKHYSKFKDFPSSSNCENYLQNIAGLIFLLRDTQPCMSWCLCPIKLDSWLTVTKAQAGYTCQPRIFVSTHYTETVHAIFRT